MQTGGATALMYACQQCRENEVLDILKKQPCSIRERDRTLKTPLHYCAENSNTTCAEALLKVSPELVNSKDENGYCPLHLAVIAGNKSLIKLLIAKGANVNTQDNEGHSAVHWAIVSSEKEALEIIIRAGANPSTPDIHGGYPLHYAVQMCGANATERVTSSEDAIRVVETLLNFGVDVNVRDKDGRQPILWAASAGSADAVIHLVSGGACVEAADKDELTALHCAASRGHTTTLETLITLCGANVDVIDGNGCSALFYSVTLGHADATELLLRLGAEPNRQDRKGRTPAHCGAAKGQLETLRILQKHGGNLWMRNVKGDIPLHEAVASGRKDLVLWLLSQNAEAINIANNDGRCPLHIASMYNNTEMVKVLLDSKSLVNPVMRTSKGVLMTPLNVALCKGHRSCGKYLQLHGGVPFSKVSKTDSVRFSPVNDTIMVDGDLSKELSSQSTMSRSPVDGQVNQGIVKIESSDKKKLYRRRKKKRSPSANTHDSDSDDSPQETKPKLQLHQEGAKKSQTPPKKSPGTSKPRKDETSEELLKPTKSKRETKPLQKTKSFNETKNISDLSPEDFPPTMETVDQLDTMIDPVDVSKSEEKLEVTFADEVKEIQPESFPVKIPDIKKPKPTEEKIENKTGSRKGGNVEEKLQKETGKEKVKKREKTTEEVIKKKEVNAEDDTSKITDKNDPKAEVKKERVVEEEIIMKKVKKTKEQTQQSDVDVQTQRKEEEHTNRDEEGTETTERETENTGTIEESKEKHKEEAQNAEKLTRDEEANKTTKPTKDDESSEAKTTEGLKTARAKPADGKETRNTEEKPPEEESKEEEPKVNEGEANIQTNPADEEQADKVDEKPENDKTQKEIDTETPPARAQSTKSPPKTPDESKHPKSPTDEKKQRKSKSDSDGNENPRKTVSPKGSKSSSLQTDLKKQEKLKTAEKVVEPEKPKTPEKENETNKGEKPKSPETNKANEDRQKAKPQEEEKGEGGKGKGEGGEEEREGGEEGKGEGGKRKGEGREEEGEGGEGGEEGKGEGGKVKGEGGKVKGEGGKGIGEEGKGEGGKRKGEGREEEGEGGEEGKGEGGKVKGEGGKEIGEEGKGEGGEEESKSLKTVAMEITETEVVDLQIGKQSEEKFEIPAKRQSAEIAKEISTGNSTKIEKTDRERFLDEETISKPSPEEDNDRQENVQPEGTMEGTRHRGRHFRTPKVSRLCRRHRDIKDDMSQVSVTQLVQNTIRKYHMERGIFYQLLELKRYQIRSGKANEQVLVKRLADEYERSRVFLGMKPFSGLYKFREFEKFLYDQLKALNTRRSFIIPEVKSYDDIDAVSGFLKKSRYKIISEIPQPELSCTCITQRCHHSACAYTNVPCSGYITDLRHHRHQKPKRELFFPRIEPSTCEKEVQRPATLELIQGNEKHVINLPQSSPSTGKKYYVTFTIKGAPALKDEDTKDFFKHRHAKSV